MPSRIDTLKIAQADLSEAESYLGKVDTALRGASIFAGTPTHNARLAVQILEKTTRRLKRSFLGEEK